MSKAKFVNYEEDKEMIINKDDIYFIRGWIIDEVINIEHRLIQIIVQYCCESSDLYNSFTFCFMKGDIRLNDIICLFKDKTVGIINYITNSNPTSTKMKQFIKDLEDIRDIRNEFAHWIRDDIDNSISCSKGIVHLTKETKSEIFDKLKIVNDKITIVSSNFDKWDYHFVMYKDWSNAKTKSIHNGRIENTTKSLSKILRKKYKETFKEFIISNEKKGGTFS